MRLPFHLGDSQTVGGNPDTIETVYSLGSGRPSPSSTHPPQNHHLLLKQTLLLSVETKKKNLYITISSIV